jgi:DNA-binding NarL/FixJ family response regulator
MRNSKPILLVEDDDIDAIAVKKMLDDLKLRNPLVHKATAEETLLYLKDRQTQKPCLLLLNLGLPKMNGIEFLRTARTENLLAKIPVVVLSASKDEQKVIESFELSIAGYLVKKTQYDDFLKVLEAVNAYWTFSELPCGD